jgi:hypothetical protein
MSSKVRTRVLDRVAGAAEAQAPGVAAAHDVDLDFGVRTAAADFLDHRLQFGRHLDQRPAYGVIGQGQQIARPAVQGRDLALDVQAHDAGADARQHRLDELPTRLGVKTGHPQGRLLDLEVGRHHVEGDRQGADFLGADLDVHPGVQIAGGDPARGLHQAGDRSGDGVGGGDADPYGGYQHQERGLDVAEAEDHLNPVLVLGRLAIRDQRGLGLLQVAHDAGLDRARDVEIRVRERLQSIERAEHVGRGELLGRDVSRVGRHIGRRRRGQEGRRVGHLGASQHPAVTVKHIGGREAVQAGEVLQIVTKGDR